MGAWQKVRHFIFLILHLMKLNKLSSLLAVLFVSCCLIACSSDDPENDNSNDNFDRSLMLMNWADNIILPSYQNFSNETNALKVASENFIAETTLENLNTLRQEWEDAYLSWQTIGMFEIGPAQNVALRSFLNTYPTNVSSIDNLIEIQNYNLADINFNDTQGFPALDYLLYGIAENDADILNLFDNDFNGDKYRQYLGDVVNRIDFLANEVLDGWQNGYRDVFVQNSGSSANSSTNRMANLFMEYYEVRLRNGKIGFPAGVFSGGNPDPSKVEGLYRRNLSKSLCLEALNAHQDFFNGNTIDGTANGESFAQYLNFLNTMKEGENLSTLINTQYNDSKNVINNLDDNFYNQINTNITQMLEAFESLQDNVVYLKSDMFSALSIALEFDSGDGD
jgi:predicted lipoprotein